MLGYVNKLFVCKCLLTMPSNVLPLLLKQTFPPIIWIFTEGDGSNPGYFIIHFLLYCQNLVGQLPTLSTSFLCPWVEFKLRDPLAHQRIKTERRAKQAKGRNSSFFKVIYLPGTHWKNTINMESKLKLLINISWLTTIQKGLEALELEINYINYFINSLYVVDHF